MTRFWPRCAAALRIVDPEAGNAVIEFIVLGVLLMAPLVYVMLAVFTVQASAYGVTEAAREAGRAFVEAKSSADAYEQACLAATLALRNQARGSFDCATELKVSCLSGACAPALTPGDTIRVEIDLPVGLPMLPTSVFGQPTAIALRASHDEVVDRYRGTR